MTQCLNTNGLKYMIVLHCAVFMALAGCGHRHSFSREDGGVILFLEHPFARTVYFASSSDDFRLRPARRDRHGTWIIDGLRNEEFYYFYVVDGKPYVPECRYSQQDDFGTTNCIYQP